MFSVFSRHRSCLLAYEHCLTGALLKQSGTRQGLYFLSPQLTYKF